MNGVENANHPDSRWNGGIPILRRVNFVRSYPARAMPLSASFAGTCA